MLVSPKSSISSPLPPLTPSERSPLASDKEVDATLGYIPGEEELTTSQPIPGAFENLTTRRGYQREGIPLHPPLDDSAGRRRRPNRTRTAFETLLDSLA